MEFFRTKRNQWSDEREMLMEFLLEQVNKSQGLHVIQHNRKGSGNGMEGKGAGQMNRSHFFTCDCYFTCVERYNNVVGDH